MPAPSRAVTAGYRIATFLLVLALLFGAFWLVSLIVGIAQGGASPLYGDTLQVSLQLSREDVGPLPPGIHLNGWPDVTVDIDDPTTEQMLLRAALDLGSEGFSIPLGALVGGLGAYILADVFAYGRRLREDVEATI